MVDTRTAGNDGSPQQLIRFQYNDHLQSACLELDELGNIISYEEYHPFGTTAYQATDASRQVPAKRYRYTGMERDEESGFNYHQARYYVPWLACWLSADPIGIGDGINMYAYLGINPIGYRDPEGTQTEPKKKKAPPRAEKKTGSAKKKADTKPKKTAQKPAGNGKIAIVIHNEKKPVSQNEYNQNIEAAKKAGYTIIKVKNGKELLDKLTKVGEIKKLTILHHGVPTGLGGEDPNSGIYVGENRAGKDGNAPVGKGGTTVAELKEKVDKGQIKFSKDATIILGGCRSADDEKLKETETFAAEVAKATGKEVTAARGRTSFHGLGDGTTPKRYSEKGWVKITPDAKGGVKVEKLSGHTHNVAP
nr:RHS repeat-associated core domain-containing protein [Longitalea arenae]